MKFNISKKWIMDCVHLEDDVDCHTGVPPDAPALQWTHFPLKEMVNRKWFAGFSGSLADAKVHANALVEGFIRSAIPRPLVSLQRQRVRSGA